VPLELDASAGGAVGVEGRVLSRRRRSTSSTVGPAQARVGDRRDLAHLPRTRLADPELFV
jgi:hypothetical protein